MGYASRRIVSGCGTVRFHRSRLCGSLTMQTVSPADSPGRSPATLALPALHSGQESFRKVWAGNHPESRGSQATRDSDRWWRWGELNPRPLLWSCAFYGCIRWKRSTRLWNLPTAAKPTSPVSVEVPLWPQTKHRSNLSKLRQDPGREHSRSDGLYKLPKGNLRREGEAALGRDSAV